MPVTKLYVEGRLDASILTAILDEDDQEVAIVEGGPKYGLKTKTLEDRKSNRIESAFFLRDRDFDYDVSPGTTSPQVISHNDHGVKVIGWHWCRHEIENYLLEPALLAPLIGKVAKRDVQESELEELIITKAQFIRHYQAARWTAGMSKRVLPPVNSQMPTRPVDEGRLPVVLDRDSCLQWSVDTAAGYLNEVTNKLNVNAVSQLFEEQASRFNEDQCTDIAWVLHMFSGKDLFAAMNNEFVVWGFQSAKDVINRVSLWLIDHPDTALATLSEWRLLLDQFKEV